jgi:hypothetical protein
MFVLQIRETPAVVLSVQTRSVVYTVLFPNRKSLRKTDTLQKVVCACLYCFVNAMIMCLFNASATLCVQ